MATYRVTDPSSGRTLKLTGDSPPTEAELTQIFSNVSGKVDGAAVKQQSVSPTDDTPEWAGKYPNLYGAMGAAKEVLRFGAETAGLVGGGITGMAAGGPLGAVAGAGLGYGIVKAGERAIEGKGNTPILEAAKTSMKDVGTGAAMEMGGQLVGGAVKLVRGKMANPVKTDVSPEQIQERMELAKSFDIELTPAEATGSKGLALYESMMDKSPFSTSIINSMRNLKQLRPLIGLREQLLEGGGKAEQVEVLGQKIQDEVNVFLGQYKSANEAQLNQLRDNVLRKLGSTETFESLGKTAQDAITAKSQAVYSQARDLYGKIGEMIPEGANINTGNLRATADRLLQEQLKKPPSMQDGYITKMLRDLSGANDSLLQEIGAYPEAVQKQIMEKLQTEGAGVGGYDWQTLQAMRSDLNSYIAQSDAAIRTAQPGAKFQSSPEAGIYKQLRKALDADIADFAKTQGGEIKQAFDLANAFYREGKLTYDSKVIRRLINTNPEKVVDAVFRPNGGFEVDAIRNAVGKEIFNAVIKPSITKRLLGEGIFSPKELSSKLARYGDEVLSKVFNSNEIKTIKALASDGTIQLEQKLAGHPFLKTLAKERPEVVVDSILGTYDKFPGVKSVLRNVALIRSVVPKETFLSLQREMSDRIFKINQISDMVQPEKLSKTLQSYDRVLQLFYTPEQVKWLRDIAQVGKLMAAAERQAANPSGTAQNVVTWGTWGAILSNPVRGIFNGVLAPQFMARLYLSPSGRKFFLNAMRTPANSGEGAKLATQIMEIGGVDAIRINERQQEQQQ
jgi:hypothetical protein